MKKIKNFITIDYVLFALISFFLICMILSPSKFINTSLNGLSAWAFNVLPSVLPFMFFTRVISTLSIVQKMTKPFSFLTQSMFKTPPISIYTFLMAILSGYPVGSKMVADLYLQGQISREDAFKMSSFCSTSGPMFIIGAVGTMMFKSAVVGYVLFLSHILGAILNGILFRNLKVKSSKNDEILTPQNIKTTLSDIVLNSTLSILSVGCIITIFFIIIGCFEPILNLLPPMLSCFFKGLIEITKGCLDLSTMANIKLSTILASFVISFGGISTILQSLTMLSELKMPIKLFVLQKITHGLFSMSICAVLTFIIF